jgi:hypothetical protein
MGMKEDLAARRAALSQAEDHTLSFAMRQEERDAAPLRVLPPPPQQQRTKAQPEEDAQFPHSVDAELGVLCSIILDPARVLPLCQNRVSPRQFHIPAHTTVYQLLLELQNSGEPIDPVVITQILRDRKQLDQVGGVPFLIRIFEFVPSAANAAYYIEIMREKFILREVMLTCQQIAKQASSKNASPTDLLDEMDSMQESVKFLANRRGPLPDLDDMSQLMGKNMPPPPEELVQGVLHRGSKLIIGGTSKGRKTWSLIDLAISVSTGTPWWGCPTIKGKVCYINFEIQRPFFAMRFAQICKAKDVTPEKGMFDCWTLRGSVEGIEKMAANMLKVLLEKDYSLIIFDPIYKALGDRDENKAGDVASMLNELEAIAVKTGAAIAFGAHYSKGNQAGKDAMDRIGGSGVFARDPDAILTMTPHETDECFTVDLTLRNFAPQKSFVVKWEWPLFTRAEEENPEQIKQAKKPGKHSGAGQFVQAYTNEDFLTLLNRNNTGRTAAEFQRLAMEHLLCSRATFTRYWSKLRSSPYIQEKNRRYYVTSLYSEPNEK